MSSVVKFGFISDFLESIVEVHHSTTRFQLRDNYIDLRDLYFCCDFLDATSSNWNIADSGTARKSDTIMNADRHPVQTKASLQTPAVHRSLNTSGILNTSSKIV